MAGFAFYNLAEKRVTPAREFFNDWQDREVVVVISPHDDDSVLGAGYAILAAAEEGAEVHVIIINDGSAGYSHPREVTTIVETRRGETQRALAVLGVPPDRICRLEVPDFSSMNYLGWKGPGRQTGESIFEPVVKYLRRVGCTRIFLPNGFREHSDHCAAHVAGSFDAIQACDPVLADWGPPSEIRSYHMYSVWGAFSPVDTQLARGWVIGAPRTAEMTIRQALQEWKSQEQIIAGLCQLREERWVPSKEFYIEIYLQFDPRPKLDYNAFRDVVSTI